MVKSRVKCHMVQYVDNKPSSNFGVLLILVGTAIITTDAEELLQALDSPEEQPCNTIVCLPHLPGGPKRKNPTITAIIAVRKVGFSTSQSVST